MAGIKTFLAGFVFRGRAPWETQPPAYHVEIGEYVDVDGRDPVLLGEPKCLTPKQAEAEAYDLSTVVTGLNTAVLTDNEDLRQRAAQAEATIIVLSERIASLEASLEAATTENLAKDAKVSNGAMTSTES